MTGTRGLSTASWAAGSPQAPAGNHSLGQSHGLSLRLPTAMKASRLPKMAGSNVSHRPVRRPSPLRLTTADPINPPEGLSIPELAGLTKASLSDTSPTDNLLPLPTRQSSHSKRNSYDSDSALGSSIPSHNGDVTDTISLDSSALPPLATARRRPSNRVRDFSTVELGGAMEIASTRTTVGDDNESGILATVMLEKMEQVSFSSEFPHHAVARTPNSSTAYSCSVTDSECHYQEETELIAAEIADKALSQMYGISLAALELRDSAMSLAEKFLQDLTNIVRNDSQYGTKAIIQEEDEGDSTPCTDQESPPSQQQSPHTGGGGGVGSNEFPPSRRLKRTRRPVNDDYDDDSDGQSHQDKKRPGPGGKGRRAADTKVYSCPFRKRSPPTFHVRGYVKCANQSYIGITNLKRHITSDHYVNQFPCSRCKQEFASPEDVRDHLQRPEGCELRATPMTMTRLQDGISQRTRDILGSRQDHNKVNTWPRLWTALFGDEEPIKESEFIPVVELDEVIQEFDLKLPPFIAALDEKLKLLCGEAFYNIFRERVEFVKAFVDQWIRNLLQECRAIPYCHQRQEVVDDIPQEAEAAHWRPTAAGPAWSSPDNEAIASIARHDPFFEPSFAGIPSADSLDELYAGWNANKLTQALANNATMTAQHRGTNDALSQWLTHSLPSVQLPLHLSSVQATHDNDNNNSCSGNSVLPPTPIPRAPQPNAPRQPPPMLIGDPIAQRAVSIAVARERAMQFPDPLPHPQPQPQPQPQTPSALKKFHERNSASGRPLAWPASSTSSRDSGVSDMGSSYSGYGNQGGFPAGKGPASRPVSTGSFGGGGALSPEGEGYVVEQRSFFHYEDDDDDEGGV